MSKFSIDTLITEVRKISKARPDTVYLKHEDDGSCSYNYGACTDGTVGCLLGQALKTIGIDTTVSENENIETVLEPLIEKDRDPKSESYPSEKIEWCAVVQMNQDQGLSWGKAVEKADNTKF